MTGTAGYAALLTSALAAVAFAALAACDAQELTPGGTYPEILTSATSLATVEGGPDATFDVSLSVAPSSQIDVVVTSMETTEGLVTIPEAGYSSPSWTLTFDPTNWNVPQTVAIQPVDDMTQDGDQTYDVTLDVPATADPLYQGVSPVNVSVTNDDVDTAGYTVTPLSGLVTSESGGTATFSVRLDTIPLDSVTIQVSTDDQTEASVSSGGGTPGNVTTLTFGPGDWNVPKVVTVTGVDDSALDGTQTWSIAVGPPSSGDPSYSELSGKTVTGTNTDDDSGLNEGKSSAPKPVAELPYAGTVGFRGASYYELTGVSGNVYVGLTGVTADVSLEVYSTAGFTNLLCSSSNVGATASEGCFLTASGTIYVLVIGPNSAIGADFVLSFSAWMHSADVPMDIPDDSAAGVTSTIDVIGAPASISKVIVTMSILHTYVGDLEVYLVSPEGTEITLSTWNGGSFDNYSFTGFDDAAALSITSGFPPFTGVYRPEEPLSTLNGEVANGAWQLKVVDSYLRSGTGTGSLSSWSIVVL